ncbi:hypothetical protein KCP78_00145 [Salmonella enterica subsp. enterica]|nr:hypothetical protein KCP78_00145 [Salmonella enterica subsp. enterica]
MQPGRTETLRLLLSFPASSLQRTGESLLANVYPEYRQSRDIKTAREAGGTLVCD